MAKLSDRTALWTWHDSTFCGLKMLQYWADLCVWERFLNQHEIVGIVELGTGQGGMSLFLLLQAQARGAMFWTFDKTAKGWTQNVLAQQLRLADHFVQGDIFEDQQAYVKALCAKHGTHPLLLYCDGGDKARELQTFAPLLQEGAYIAVHDWNTEIRPADVEPVADILEPVFAEECQSMSSLTRFWRRR